LGGISTAHCAGSSHPACTPFTHCAYLLTTQGFNEVTDTYPKEADRNCVIAALLIVNCDFNVVLFINRNFEILVPFICTGGVGLGSLSAFNLDDDCRVVCGFSFEDWRMIELLGTFNGDIQLPSQRFSQDVLSFGIER
jgi:hypothetical protein